MKIPVKLLEEWKAWDEDLKAFEKNRSPQRSALLRAIEEKWYRLEAERLELQAMHQALQNPARHITEHDALKISLVNVGQELTELAINLVERITHYSRSATIVCFIRRLLGMGQNLVLEFPPFELQVILNTTSELDERHRSLARYQAALDEDIKRLRMEYEMHILQESSHLAARSLGPYGIPGERPWEPLSRLLKAIAIETKQNPLEIAALKKVQSGFKQRSDILLAECSENLATLLSSSGAARKKPLRQIRKTLSDIKSLEEEMESTLKHAAMSDQGPSLLVKKNSEQYKT